MDGGRPVSRSASRSASRILLVAPAWVGDMVMMDALLQLLRQRHPAVALHVLAPPATDALAGRLRGIEAHHLLPVGHGEFGFGRRRALARQLRSHRFDQAIVLPNTWKSALVPALAGIPWRTGWHGEARYGLLNDRRSLDPERHPLMIERFMALGLAPGEPLRRPYPVPGLVVDPDNRQRLLDSLGLKRSGRVLALCPGAEFGPAKRWPAPHYAALARHAAARGEEVWLLGSPGEQQAAEEIRQLAPAAINLAGRTRLVDAIDLLSAADTVVCNDSGLMHVACAVGTPVVAVFGSTSPAFTPPLGERAQVIQRDMPCSPCFARTCPLGHASCLKDLEPRRVIEAL